MSGLLGNFAKNALSGGDKDDNNNEQKSGEGWTAVGQSAKEVLSSYNESGGKVNYVEVGSLARKAVSAYKADGDKFDRAEAGKELVSGFVKGGKSEDRTSSVCHHA